METNTLLDLRKIMGTCPDTVEDILKSLRDDYSDFCSGLKITPDVFMPQINESRFVIEFTVHSKGMVFACGITNHSLTAGLQDVWRFVNMHKTFSEPVEYSQDAGIAPVVLNLDPHAST